MTYYECRCIYRQSINNFLSRKKNTQKTNKKPITETRQKQLNHIKMKKKKKRGRTIYFKEMNGPKTEPAAVFVY